MNVCFLAVEWKEHFILFEDIKRGNSDQCFFIGVPFMIMGMKWLDSVHDVYRSISAKKSRMEKNNKVDYICSFVIIKTNLTKLGKNIVALLCSWNKVAHFKENRVCKFVASLYFIPTAFFCDTVCVCMCMSVFVCVCICPQAFISFHSKGPFLSKMMSKTCTRQTNISWLTSLNSTFLHLNIQNS